MADDKVCDDMIVLLQNDTLPCNPLWVPSSSTTLQGGESMVNFENVGAGDSVDESQFFQQTVKEETEDDDFDSILNPRGKKRRLSPTQVQFLERTFEVENKLEPERKIQVAKELGLQPRQVAVWFQNRRARFKNKQLERDYDTLKSSYDKLKLDYDNLLKEKENLNNQFVALKEKLEAAEEKEENSEAVKMGSEKQENAKAAVTTSSGKSDVLDTDSPDSFLGPVDSCQVFESDFSHEEDELSRSFLPQQFYSKVYHEPTANSTSFELSGEDQAFWSWSF